MKIDDLYNNFFDYLDKTIPAVIIPAVGDMPSKMIMASDLLSEHRAISANGYYFIDNLFKQWVKDTYGKEMYENL